MKELTNDFWFSPSGVGNFFGCPQKYKLSKKWTTLKPKPWMELGSQVHALMEGRMPNECWPKALRIAERLAEAELDYGFVVHEREVKEKVTFGRGNKMVRIIDAVGEYQGEPVLIDYKVPNKPWDTVSKCPLSEDEDGKIKYGPRRPKGMGFQPTSYLWKRPEKKMYFLVAPADDSPAKAHLYEPTPEDVQNLKEAVRIVRHATKMGYFPRNRGFQCKWCDLASACYKKKGWEDEYAKRN